MPNSVIRVGGSSIGNEPSIQNLTAFLEKSHARVFLVVSAVPRILDIIGTAIEHVFEINPDEKAEQLATVFYEMTGEMPTSGYRELTEQCINILKGISLIGDYSEALSDQVKSFSEKLTAEIFQHHLAKNGKPSRIIDPGEFGLKASSDFGNATYLSVDESFFGVLEEGFFIVPGSFGISEGGKIARAGKTAADYTAAFLAQSLGVAELELWGLDHDFQRADPQIVDSSPRIERLTYSEASELAYFDHYSFHPRTVEPLESRHIPIRVLNTSTAEGIVETSINTEAYVEGQIVKSVACTDDISLLRLNGPGVGLKPGILARVTSSLNEAGINIKSVITSQISINLILEKDAGDKALELMQQPDFSSVKEISVIKDISLIGVVGHGMQQNYGVSARIFSAVSQSKINVLLSGSGASDLVSYLVVKSSDKERSVRKIYEAFFPESGQPFNDENVYSPKTFLK